MIGINLYKRKKTYKLEKKIPYPTKSGVKILRIGGFFERKTLMQGGKRVPLYRQKGYRNSYGF